ncbi:unnamed protein product [Amoebophrya sp. A25]|nr:unnamed protein product [Amoebophrya sp. A25]|eukprot:GSA25T00017485001.1
MIMMSCSSASSSCCLSEPPSYCVGHDPPLKSAPHDRNAGALSHNDPGDRGGDTRIPERPRRDGPERRSTVEYKDVLTGRQDEKKSSTRSSCCHNRCSNTGLRARDRGKAERQRTKCGRASLLIRRIRKLFCRYGPKMLVHKFCSQSSVWRSLRCLTRRCRCRPIVTRPTPGRKANQGVAGIFCYRNPALLEVVLWNNNKNTCRRRILKRFCAGFLALVAIFMLVSAEQDFVDRLMWLMPSMKGRNAGWIELRESAPVCGSEQVTPLEAHATRLVQEERDTASTPLYTHRTDCDEDVGETRKRSSNGLRGKWDYAGDSTLRIRNQERPHGKQADAAASRMRRKHIGSSKVFLPHLHLASSIFAYGLKLVGDCLSFFSIVAVEKRSNVSKPHEMKKAAALVSVFPSLVSSLSPHGPANNHSQTAVVTVSGLRLHQFRPETTSWGRELTRRKIPFELSGEHKLKMDAAGNEEKHKNRRNRSRQHELEKKRNNGPRTYIDEGVADAEAPAQEEMSEFAVEQDSFRSSVASLVRVVRVSVRGISDRARLFDRSLSLPVAVAADVVESASSEVDDPRAMDAESATSPSEGQGEDLEIPQTEALSSEDEMGAVEAPPVEQTGSSLGDQDHLDPLDRLQIPLFHGSDIDDQKEIAGMASHSSSGNENGDCSADVKLEIFLDYESPPRTPDVCSVRFIGADELAKQGETPGFDFYFTDSLHKVPYLGRRDNWFFLERFERDYWPLDELTSIDMDALMRNKTNMISMLAPAIAEHEPERLSYQFRMLLQQAQRIFPQHVFFDDKTDETYKRSMDPYRFCMILDDELPRVSMAYLRALRHHCVPIFNGFSDFGGMFYDAVMPFEDLLNLPAFLENLNDLDHQIGALWSYQRTLQDMLYYRYRQGFTSTLKQYACTICRMHQIRKQTRRDAPLVFVGVYSALKNFQKRNVLRSTWLRVLKRFGIQYKFFLNADNAVVRAENDQYGDMIFLGVSEGYRLNSRKGLLFHNWIAAHSNALYLLKIDDDIYFRPAPFLEQLRFKSPFMYIWGYFDYISPVPRDPSDHFFNPPEIYPYEMFPPYPRGVVRIVSMDVIRRFAELDRQGKLRTIFGDDPNMGVHMRHIVFDPDNPMSLNLDDIDSYKVFAMNPECKILNNTEPEIDPENPSSTKKVKQWSPMTNRSWVFHHVNHEQIQCMWNTDVATGYYDAQYLYPRKLIREGFPNLCPCIKDYGSWRTRRTELEAWEEDRRQNPVLQIEEEYDPNKPAWEMAHPMA